MAKFTVTDIDGNPRLISTLLDTLVIESEDALEITVEGSNKVVLKARPVNSGTAISV